MLSNIRLYFTETGLTLRLALPLIAAALAQMGMEVVDSLMLARLGAEQLAAASLGLALFMIIWVACAGLMNGVSVLTARAYGSKQTQLVATIVQHGLWLAIFISVPLMLLIWHLPGLLLAIGEHPDIVALSSIFLHSLLWAMLPTIIFLALREFVSAVHAPHILMFIALIDIPLQFIFNDAFIYGKWGFPATGIAGVGWATVAVECFSVGVLILYISLQKRLLPYRIFNQFCQFQLKQLLEIVRIGLPVGTLYVFEAGLFGVATLFMGFFGATALAAHQVALQSLSVAFMPPLGISQASAIRVSEAIGGQNKAQAQRAAVAGLLLGLAIAIIAALIFWRLPTLIISLFFNVQASQNQDTVNLAKTFLTIAAVFEIMDSAQVILSGILRGLKDTFVPMWVGLLSYWLVGVGSASLLAFVWHWQGRGIWWGLALGITVSALLLLWRCKVSLQRA